MKRAIRAGLGLVILAAVMAGSVRAQDLANEEIAESPEAARVAFGGNFVTDPCLTCKYNPDPSGYAILGPENCEQPGSRQWEGIPFIAAASGVVDRITTSIILDSATCLQDKVTVGIYADTCGEGPGELLASGEATVAPNSCAVAVAKLSNGPSLVQGIKYWVAATTSSAQTDLTARWYASNYAQTAANVGDGWIQSTVFTPAFNVLGHVSSEEAPVVAAGNARQAFASNLVVDPCTECDYGADDGGFPVWGPDNCTSPGSTIWLGVPFIAGRTGTPKSIQAAILLNKPTTCPQNKVTLSIYTDDCGQGPGTLLVSGVARAASKSCDLPIAKLSHAPILTKGTKYWITATTTAEQSALDATWRGSNNAEIAVQTALGGWFQVNTGTPAFEVQ